MEDCGKASSGAPAVEAPEAEACCQQDTVLAADGAVEWFANMIPNCLAYAKKAKAEGRKIVGILCEFTPREIILAAGGVPVCLCGGSARMIAPAEQHLPNNLCPLIKSTYGYHVTRSNPFLEMADLIVAETTCDGKKKMYELMADTRPMCVLELPQKSDDERGLAAWHDELVRLKEGLERRFAVRITDQKLWAAIATMNRERKLRRDLAGLMKLDRPPITGRQLLDFKSSISGIACDFAQYEEAFAALSATAGDAEMGRRVRVLMTGVPLPHGAERVLDIIEKSGGLVVAMENCTGLKPILDDVDETDPDPLRAIARKYYHLPCSVMTRNTARLELLRKLAAEYRAQCIIELVWQACLTYDVEAHYIKRLAEQELGLPYLRLVTDYSPSDSARLTTRVEATFETVRQRQKVP